MQTQTLSWRQESPRQGANGEPKQAWAGLQVSMEQCLPGKLCSDRQAQRQQSEQRLLLLLKRKLVGYHPWDSVIIDIHAACRQPMLRCSCDSSRWLCWQDLLRAACLIADHNSKAWTGNA